MVNFDPNQDRLICVGDLLNRGDENMRALDYLQQSWFYSVLGNHDWVHAFDNHSNFEKTHINKNNLKWAMNIRHKTEYKALSTRLSQLPLMIEIETPAGLVGIVHGEIGTNITSWQQAKDSLNDIHSLSNSHQHPFMVGRTRHKKNNINVSTPVEGVYMVISGHTPQKFPIWIGNCLFIDTGLVYGIKNDHERNDSGLTLINLNEHIAHYFPFSRRKGILDTQEVSHQALKDLAKKKDNRAKLKSPIA
jgi:serine/threonine protein phosphatase 1